MNWIELTDNKGYLTQGGRVTLSRFPYAIRISKMTEPDILNPKNGYKTHHFAGRVKTFTLKCGNW